MKVTLQSAVSAFGADAKTKLSVPVISGEPEDQLRSPLEDLIEHLAELSRLNRSDLAIVGETSLKDLGTCPDFAVVLRDALVGFIEVKAPGKGADPRKFKGQHDKQQWEKLRSLPNLVYTDGNEFSLWRSGELAGTIVRLGGDIESSGAELTAPQTLLTLFEDYFSWEPIPPRNAKQLAEISARLCRLLRDEVAEQMNAGNDALTALATDWRRMLFPEATDRQFADGYAQAVTFGLLIARARGIQLHAGLDHVARELGTSSSIIGAALRILTDDVESQMTLKTSLGTLTRVLDVVEWEHISKDDPDAWLYFYEDFLAVYDNQLRKQTGSYYTPPKVVRAMVRMVDEVLKSPAYFGLSNGLAEPEVTVADPAVGAGTFLLGVMRRIADTIEQDQGKGAVPEAINDAVTRLIGFEMQFGPFAVAQLRVLAEVTDLTGEAPTTPLRLFVTNTLGNPYVEEEWMPAIFRPIAESRRQANDIKKAKPITVVIGNPPYREKAKGLGGWVEGGYAKIPGILKAWMPPAEWGVGAHVKHLRNLYVYFWRWATWKVFDQDPNASTGIVCFITVAGFLNGPGFEKMRDYLRRQSDDIWVIDCSPEGHQPEVATRIFQGVQQPVCIVLASRSPKSDSDTAAAVHYRALQEGTRENKFKELSGLSIDDNGWVGCPSEWRAAFLPEATGAWSTFPAIEDLFFYNGSGVMPGRTWIIAPDCESLEQRWNALINAPEDQKEELFHPHLRRGNPGDKHSKKSVAKGLYGHEFRCTPVAEDRKAYIAPTRYAFRSFDRQWIIPDNRLINQPNLEHVWGTFSKKQVFLTVLHRTAPLSGPAVTFTAEIPDLDHFNGRGGRVFPLWYDRDASQSNVKPAFVNYLGKRYHKQVAPGDVMAYIAAVAAHPAFTKRFASDLVQPGLRIPLSADADLFFEAVGLGREVIWLHTFGERFVDAKADRPKGPPRLPKTHTPRIPSKGKIPSDPASIPDEIRYDASKNRLYVGTGYIEPVSPEVWSYEVSRKQVLRQWFSYRRANRERPIIGDRRPPSRLNKIQPDHWLAEYTSELLNTLNVLGRLVNLESHQADLLERICSAPMLPVDKIKAANAFASPNHKRRESSHGQPEMFD